LIAAIGIARQPARLDEAALFGMACIGMLILSPIGRGHYYMEELPALVCVPIWFARRGELRWAWAAMVIPASLCVAHYVLMSITGRIGLLGIGTSVWYLAVMCQLISSGFRPQAVAVVPARSRISESRRAA
jgi:hypothetical protein